jgi:hypothetical protein
MMNKPPKVDAQELLHRVMRGLGSYRDGVVLVGGFARDLYRYQEGFADLALRPPATNDVDFAVDNPFQIFGDRHLHDILLQAGLQHRALTGLDHQPMGCVYYAAELADPRPTDPHVEFVTPLRGPDRDGKSQPQHDDLFAFALRFIDLLLDDPVSVTDPKLGRVRIPHPLAYVIQKTRIRPKRREERKAAKDQADAFFVIVSLQAKWDEWRPRWDRIAQHQEQGSWLRETQRLWTDLYKGPTSLGAREVAYAYPGYSADDACRIIGDFQATFSTR